MVITGGVDWSDVLDVVDGIHWGYGWALILYIYFMLFLGMNVVTGTVVDVTSGVCKRDRGMVVQEEGRRLKRYTADFKKLFTAADQDHSGHLTWDEFKHYLSDDTVKAYFHSLDLDINQAHVLFK